MKIEWMEICRVLGCKRKRQCDAPVCPRCWHLTPRELREACFAAAQANDHEAAWEATRAVLSYHRRRRMSVNRQAA